jgi:outer membrane immunogenic protein
LRDGHKKASFVAVIAASLFAAVSSPALADGPSAVKFGWTGFYAGWNAGAAIGDLFTEGLPPLAIGNRPPLSPTSSQVTFGGQAGYNYQMGGLVIGAETDIAYTGLRGTAAAPTQNGFFNVTSEQSSRWFGTIRGRLGVLPANGLLLYVTGGFAYGDVGVKSSFIVQGGDCARASCGEGSSRSVSTGWALGAGFEYALTSKLSLKAEYLRVDLGSLNLTYPLTLTVTQYNVRADFAEDRRHHSRRIELQVLRSLRSCCNSDDEHRPAHEHHRRAAFIRISQ